MWPATLELLAIAAAISAIVAYSAHSGVVRHHREVDGKMAAQGQANSPSAINAAEKGTDQPDIAAGHKAATGQRERESEAFSGRPR